MACHTILYARKSHEEDDRQILSLDAQEKECRLHAERHALPLGEVIRESHSARRPGRPLFTAMLRRVEARLKQGQAVRVLAHKPDRLLRNIGDWARLNDLMDAGLELAFVTGSYENNAHGRLAFGVNVVFAKFYVDNLSEEVCKGLKEKLARGEWPGWAPLGYVNVRERHARKRIVVDPVAGPLVTRAFELYATGEYSLASLSRQLTGLGLVGRVTGKPLVKSILRDRILANPFYCGLFRYRGELHPGTHDPLISVALFEQVQAVLAGKSRPKRRRHEFRYSGLLTCGTCGCAVVGDLKKQRYVYYRCSHRRGGCTEGYLREERLQALLQQHTAERLSLRPQAMQSLRAAAEELARRGRSRAGAPRVALERRQRELGSRLGVLLDMRLAGTISDAQYTGKREELVREEARVREELAAFELPVAEPCATVEWFISTCNSAAKILQVAARDEAREFLRIVGSNYRLTGGKVDFEPVEPFTLAAQARNRPNWRAGQDDVRTLCSDNLIHRKSESTTAGSDQTDQDQASSSDDVHISDKSAE